MQHKFTRLTAMTKKPGSSRLLSVLGLCCCLLSLVSGCSRPFWREQASNDAYNATAENFTDPRWDVPRIDVTPDPRSRFFDPYDPDYEPLPPDDPAAHVYMHWVDGWQGYNCWHKFGDVLSVENPQWLLPFKMTPEQYNEETGTYVGPFPEIENLTLGEALELALINNRDYQTQIENVFLTALVVTGERFRFSVRYLNSAGQTPGGSVTGNFVPHSSAGAGEGVFLSAGAGIRQFLPTGGQWVVELTNNTIWLFGGGNQTRSASLLSFALTQPLLQGAGRIVNLESLTQAERDLLYAVRDLARFRREFFTSVVGGPAGYLSLLRQVQQIRNSESNIFRLREQVEALQEISSQRSTRISEPLAQLPENVQFPAALADRIAFDAEQGELTWFAPLSEEVPMTEEQAQMLRSLSNDPLYQRAVGLIIQRLRAETVSLDVLRLQSQLANSINTLRQQERGLQDSLDDFKILLGLPPDFVMTIDDQLLEPFQFIDSQLIDLEREVIDFIPIWGQIDEEEPDREVVQAVAERFQELQQQAMEIGLNLIRGDFERLEAVYEQRLADMPSELERERLEYDVRRDRQLFDGAVFDLEEMSQTVNEIAEQSRDRSVPIGIVKEWRTKLKVAQETLLKTVQALQAIEVGLRVELVELQPYEYGMEESVNIALQNRLDLKNVQASVMDARRQVEVVANALKSVLDLELAADFGTTNGPDPFDFRGELSDLAVGLSFDTPIDQIQERNLYRSALVNYQRARRDYMLYEDRVKQEVRDEWRQMEVLRRNLETARQALRISVAQFDSAVEQAYAPPRPGAQPQFGTGGLQGQQIQDALDGILRAQDNIIGIWVSYEQSRLNIYRDMGIMEIGPDNVWEDPFYREQTAGEGGSFYGDQFPLCPVDGMVVPAELLPEGSAPLMPQPVDAVGTEGNVSEASPAAENSAQSINTTGLGNDEPKRPLRILGPLP